MNRKIWKALGIAVCMLALAAPRAMAKTYEVKTGDKFAEAVQEINNKSSDTENEIVLCDDIELTSGQMLTRGQTTIKSKDKDHKISIKGKNAGITVTGEKTVLNLGANGYDKKLTIEEDTRDGSASENPRVAFITVSGGATANMYGNVTLQNGKFAGNACVVIMGSDPVTGSKSVFNMHGGVIEKCSRAVMADSGTTFNMSGGEIRNCGGGRGSGNGGGVRVYEATFVMSDGTISGCSADTGGGLCAEKSSTVTISGGTISGCTALSPDKGNGGGLYVEGSTITIKKGTISGCKANTGGGLYATNSLTINIKGGTISECEANAGGGLYATNSSKITIKKGTISGCKAVNGYGGGLYAENYSTVTIEGGTISECCTTSDIGMGGGLYAYHSTITISGGTIEKNRAVYGGGVALNNSWINPITITNWKVIGNKAYKTKSGNGGIGGGIYLDSVSMVVSDGSNRIYNNQAERHGADICMEIGASIKLPIAANMGATFGNSGIKIDGWYNDNPRYTPSKDVDPVDVSETLTNPRSLVASYKADPVRIEIDANGGVGGSGSQTVQKGTNVTLEAPTKEGHLFKGWKDEKGNSYPAGEDGKVKITVTGDMTLTAAWEARTFTVTYVLLNGETRTETAAYGETVTLGEEPRTGYTFVGWKDSEKMYHAGETITVTGDMTLTAEWKKLPSAENLPKTGDESPVLLWGAALAVSAAACFMLRRRK